MDRDRPDGSRRLRGPAIVLAVLLVTAFGGYGVASVLTGPVGAPVGIDGLRVDPLSGWAAAGTGEVRGWAVLRLTKGSGTLDLAVRAAGSGGEGAAVIGYVGDVLRGSLSRLAVSAELERARVGSTLSGVRFGYTGVDPETGQAIEGAVTVAIGPRGQAWAFDVWAPTGLLPFVLPDVDAMIERAEVA